MHRRFAANPATALRALLAAALLSTGVVPSAVAVNTFALRGAVLGSGASIRSRSACFALASTTGQGVTGAGSSANFSLAPGYWRAHRPARESVFSSSFEDCGP